MGLDNGFVVKMDSMDEKDIPSYILYNTYGELYEFAYWRKCYGIRNLILTILYPYENDAYIKVSASHLRTIAKELHKFLSRPYWEAHADTFWTYEEIIDNLINSCIALRWLSGYLEDHPEVKCYFYDSE